MHTFGPGLALDKITMRGLASVVAELEDAETGEPVTAYSLEDDETEVIVATNRYGYYGQFRVPDTVDILRITFGDLTLENVAWEIFRDVTDAVEAIHYRGINLDDDGVPYYTPENGQYRINLDADGVPFFTI